MTTEELAILSSDEDRNVWIRVGTLIDGTSEKPVKNANLIFNSRIIRFADTGLPPKSLLNGQKQPDMVLDNYTALPGLIEAHAHLFLEGAELNFTKRKEYLLQRPDQLLEQSYSRLDKLVRLGVIGVRDAGDKDGVGLALSRLYESGQRPLMPYVDSPGAAIHHQGRYGSFMAEPLEDFSSLRACVESRIQNGADRIKLIPTGIINFKQGKVTKEPQMTVEEVKELVRVSNELGKQTFAHASGDDGIDHVVDGRVDSVEHGFFIREDQLSKMRDYDIAWVPTFAPVQKQVDFASEVGWEETEKSNLRKILDGHAASLRSAFQKGVRVIAGSDAGSMGVGHGVDFIYELELMEQAGISSLSVINSATGSSSERLGYKEKFGQIKPGFLSRFILTSHSPLSSVSNLRKHKYVVFDGSVYESDENTDFTGL